MTVVLDMPSELEAELSKEAERFGLPLAEYALRLILEARSAGTVVRSGEVGLVGTRTDVTDSLAHARMVRQQAERHLHQ